MKKSLFFYFLFSSGFIFAQDSLYNLTLQTEFIYYLEKDYVINFNFREQINTPRNLNLNHPFKETGSSFLLKIDRTKKDIRADQFIKNLIPQKLESGKIEAFSIKDRTKKLSATAIDSLLYRVDTIIAYSPHTYKEVVSYQKKNYAKEYLTSFKVVQKWHFSSTSVHTKVMGIIPRLEGHLPNKGVEELCWIPFKENTVTDADSVINNPNNVWVRYASNEVVFSKAKILEGNIDTTFKKLFWLNPKNNLLPIYDASTSFFNSEKLNNRLVFEELENLSIIDTAVLFNRDTYEEDPVYRKRGTGYEEYIQYELHQLWFYDIEKHQLNASIIGVAPIMGAYIPLGSWFYKKPFFLLKVLD